MMIDAEEKSKAGKTFMRDGANMPPAVPQQGRKDDLSPTIDFALPVRGFRPAALQKREKKRC